MAEPTAPEIPDAHADLGLQPTASSADIKTAYCRLALLHHPDKNPNVTDAAEFRKVKEAYDILEDSQIKARYDQRYSQMLREWVKYKSDVAEFNKNPDTWRRKNVSAPRVPPRHTGRPSYTQTHHGYDDADEFGFNNGRSHTFSSAEEFFEHMFGFSFGLEVAAALKTMTSIVAEKKPSSARHVVHSRKQSHVTAQRKKRCARRNAPTSRLSPGNKRKHRPMCSARRHTRRRRS